jgi:hypothetical protein
MVNRPTSSNSLIWRCPRMGEGRMRLLAGMGRTICRRWSRDLCQKKTLAFVLLATDSLSSGTLPGAAAANCIVAEIVRFETKVL